jgi:hypothetical protein
MEKCNKCGREYAAIHVQIIRDKKSREIPQPKSECPRCNKVSNRRGFVKDAIKRSTK